MQWSKIHYITQELEGQTHLDLVRQALAGGIEWVQLRAKGIGQEEWIRLAEAVKEECDNYDATLIINDSPEVAKEVGADGVHLGKEDMSPKEARILLGHKAIIGGTANSFEDISRLARAGVDYVGIGPFRETSTKENLAPVLGESGITEIVNRSKDRFPALPLVAIGGITVADLDTLFSIDLDGVAAASAINCAESPKQAAQEFVSCCEEQYERIANW